MRVVACTILLVSVVALTFTRAQAQDAAVLAKSATAKFVNFPGIPACMTASVANGDPNKTGSVLFVKAKPGCVVPWHWHTPTEQLMIVSGTLKVEMKDGAPANLHVGDYVSLPTKHVHQATCLAACTFFVSSDTAFDIHYVDKDGKEISPEDALKAKAKTPAKKAPEKDDMKDMKM